MGGLFFFDEVVSANDNKGKHYKCQVEVLDNSRIPEIRIGPVGAAYDGSIAEFNDLKQFDRFVEAINNLHERFSLIKH